MSNSLLKLFNSSIRLTNISIRNNGKNLFRHYSDSKPSILIQLKTDMKQAMREKNKDKLTVIKSIISDIGYAEKSTQPFSVIESDGDVANILQKAIKKRNDSIEQYKQGNRQDLVDLEQAEVDILKAYLPAPLSEREIIDEIQKVIKDINANSIKQPGQVIKAVKLDPARAPKSIIANLAKKLLSESK